MKANFRGVEILLRTLSNLKQRERKIRHRVFTSSKKIRIIKVKCYPLLSQVFTLDQVVSRCSRAVDVGRKEILPKSVDAVVVCYFCQFYCYWLCFLFSVLLAAVVVVVVAKAP